MDISSNQDRIAILLNAPYTPAPDNTVPKKGEIVVVNIYVHMPTNVDDYISMYPVCMGRYDITGDGKSSLSDLLSRSLPSLVKSFEELKDNIILCPVSTPALQYFIGDDDKVHRRNDEYSLGFRPLQAEGSSPVTNRKEPGILVTDTGVMTRFGLAEVASEPKPLPPSKPFTFPVTTWTDIEGYYDPRQGRSFVTGIAGVSGVSMLRSGIGIGPGIAVHVMFETGEQLNLFNDVNDIGMELRYIQPVVQDNFFKASRLLCVIIGKDGNYTIRPLQAEGETGVMVKIDYWQGEILRATYYKDDMPFYPVPDQEPTRYRYGIDHMFRNGDKLIKFYKAMGPDAVIRPSYVTVFDSSFKPTVYDTSLHDIIIDEVRNGFVTAFTMSSISDGAMVRHVQGRDGYYYALIGDHSKDAPVSLLDEISPPTSKPYLAGLVKTALSLGAGRKLETISIDKVAIDHGIKFDINSVSTAEKLIRHAYIVGFDENLTPLSIKIELEDITL